MDKIDLEGFFIKNKIALIAVFATVIIIIAAVFGIRYYNGMQNKKASKLLWKGIRLYMSYDGKNPSAVVKSVSYLKKLRSEYGGTNAAKISCFYTGLDYMRMGKFKNSSSYFNKYVKYYPKSDSNNLTYLAYSNLATVSMLEKNYKSAISDFAAMSKINDVKLQEYAMLEEAAVYTKIKEPKKAVALYKTMLTNDAMTKDRGYIENLIQLNN
jgi:predicted negative regulator of RcsB-dependent stress response